MKKRLSLFALTFSLMLISFSLVSASPIWVNSSGDDQNLNFLNTGLEAGYNFDQTDQVTDIYIGVNNGTNYAILGEAGLINNSAHLYGNPAYLYFPAFHTTQSNISYSFWLYWETGGDGIVERLWSSHSEFDSYIAESDSKITFIPYNSETFTTNSAVTINGWTHIVYTCNNEDKNQSVYIDGVLDTSVVNTLGCPVMNDPNGLYFGRVYSSGNRYYKGLIDDAYFWNRALNKTDVEALYNSAEGVTLKQLPPIITDIASLFPPNQTTTSGDIINYTANISCSEGCSNATLYFKNSTDTIHSVFTDLTGISDIELGNEVNLSVYNGDGTFVWYYDLRDTANNGNMTEEREITIHIFSPIITWNNPSTDIYSSATTYDLNISLLNFLLETANVTIFNSTGNVIYNNYTEGINLSTFDILDTIPLDEGVNTIEILTMDNASLTTLETKTITRDTIFPTIAITSPIVTTYHTKPNSLTGTFTEANCDSIWYSLNNGVSNSSIVNCNNYSYFSFSGLSGNVNTGSNTWRVYLNDTLGNENSTSVTFDYSHQNLPNEITGSGIIYEIMGGTGAGLGLLFNYIVATLPNLLIDLILIVVILSIAWGVYSIIQHFSTHIKGGK